MKTRPGGLRSRHVCAAAFTIATLALPVAAKADPLVIGSPTQPNIAKPWNDCREHTFKPEWVCGEQGTYPGNNLNRLCNLKQGTMKGGLCYIADKSLDEDPDNP